MVDPQHATRPPTRGSQTDPVAAETQPRRQDRYEAEAERVWRWLVDDREDRDRTAVPSC